MFNRTICIFALAFMTSVPALAAAPPSVLNADEVASIKSIGVISAIGDTINVGTNGPLLRLSMSQKVVPISDLEIDRSLEEWLAQELGAQFKIEPVQVNRELFSHVKDSSYLIEADLPPLEKLVKPLSASVDAYLVVSKNLVPLGASPEILRPGLNIGRGGFHEDQYEALAFITISVIDAHTSNILAKVIYPAPISRFWGGTVESLPFDGALWPDDAGNFSSQQRVGLKIFFLDKLETILGKSVSKLGLLPVK